jgi:hypothetical protein
MGKDDVNVYFGRYGEGGQFRVGLAVSQQSTGEHDPVDFGPRLKSDGTKGAGWVRYDQHVAAASNSRAQWEASLLPAEAAWYTGLTGARRDRVWGVVHATATAPAPMEP